MLIVLTLITALVVLLFFSVLALYLVQIARTLEAIGGSPDSFLAKLRLGLRAIEQETSFLPTEVTKLNQGLTAVASGLQQVDRHLVKTIDAVVRQEDRS
jgi:predicted PurR-regulated permease PerM